MNPLLPNLGPVLLLVFWWAIPSQRCWAQATSDAAPLPHLVVTNPDCCLDAGGTLQFIRDSSRQASLAQVMAKPLGEWRTFKTRPTSFGFTSDVFWLRLRLKSGLPEAGEAMVELDNPRMETVDWFAVRHAAVQERARNGNQHPAFEARPRSRAPCFRVKLAAGEAVEVFARVESRTSMFLPVRVYGSPETRANVAAKRDWVAVAVGGYFGSIFCLSVILGFIMRSRLLQINALLALLLCSYFLLVDGSWARLGLPFAAQLALQPTMLMIASMDFLVLLFMREFIPPQLKSHFPSRMLGGVQLLVLGEMLVIPFVSYEYNFYLVAGMSVVAIGSCTGVAGWLRRIQPGGGTRLLLAAWLTNLGVVIGVILELTGVLPTLLPLALAPAIYGVTVSGLLLAASAQRAHEYVREQLRASELEKSLAQARLLALRYQVNPHFLFNALNSAIALVRHEPSRVTPFLYRLADFLRAALRMETALTVPLSEEVEKLSAYLEVEKVRFEERLDIALEVPAGLGRCQVPELILQPLVENAIKHGLSQPAKNYHIWIRARRTDDRLEIEVANNGRLISPPDANNGSTGIGLNNLRERLRLLYQESASLTLTEADGWVIGRLSLPAVEPALAPKAASLETGLGSQKEGT